MVWIRRKPEEPKRADAEAKKPATPEKAEKPADKTEKANAPAESNGDPAEAHAIVLDVVESLFEDRDGNLWGSMVKQVLKRKRPQFSESYYGYRTFNQLLEEMAKAELLEVEKEEKSGNYVILGFGSKA